MPLSTLLPPDVEGLPPDQTQRQVFILSPANSTGLRSKMVLRPGATFPLAREVRSKDGATLADVFTFTSGLYFRGKRLYAERYARPPKALSGAWVITPGRGLLPLDTRVTAADLLDFANVPVDPEDPRYREPLERDARTLARKAGRDTRVVLLGSIASKKYTSILLEAFADRLCFPVSFVSRGDMSRGGLLLRCVRAGVELRYACLDGAQVRGARPLKFPKAITRAARESPSRSR